MPVSGNHPLNSTVMAKQMRTSAYKGTKTRITIPTSMLSGHKRPQKQKGIMANIGNEIYAMFKYGQTLRGYMQFVH